MIGRRASDIVSPGFKSVMIMFIALALAAAALTFLPPQNVMIPKPVDGCVDGIVQSWDGEKWHPVTIDRKSRYYDGKKWVPDYPAGHVRTIPCGEQK